MVQLKRKWKCPIKANHSCQTTYESTQKLTRHVAAYEANQTRKGRKPKIKSSRVKSVIKSKNRIFKCPGSEKTRKDGKWVVCKKEHDSSAFYARQVNTVSEGIILKFLEKKIGSAGFVDNNGTTEGLFDIGVYDKKLKSKVKYTEVKPRNPGRNGEQLLKPGQRDWAIKKMNLGILCDMFFYKEKNFVFYHSDPVKLTMKNIEKFSQPWDEEKEKALEKISFKKLLNNKKMEKLTEELTGHSVKIIRKMFKQLQK